jgi:hypothetical protein
MVLEQKFHTRGGAAAWNQSKAIVSDAMLIGGILYLC